MSKIEIDERVFEIVEWEIHLRRCLVHALENEVQAAVQLGFAEQRLLDIVAQEIGEVKQLFEQARTKTFEELRSARMNGFRFPKEQSSSCRQ